MQVFAQIFCMSVSLLLKVTLLICLAWPVLNTGQAQVPLGSFEGSWRLNRQRSEDLAGGLAGADYGLEVTRTGDELTVEERVTIRGRRLPSQPLIYRLDGEETTSEVSRPIAGTIELQARSLAKGRQLELKSTISGENQGEQVTLITRELWELVDRDRSLKITRTREFGEMGTQTVLVFERR
jgi:hypothetical protein